MRVLITNNAVSDRSGTELYTRDVATELMARGHQAMVFTLQTGRVAEELREMGVPVVEDLRQLPATPEVIHGHHVVETTLAGMTFPKVPVISFCHGPEAWQEAPCRLPNVFGWVAVDDACYHRLVNEEGIAPDRVQVLLNFVDLARFPVRSQLPPVPRRALVFSNYLSAHHPVTIAIEEACDARGIELHRRGLGFDTPCDAPETLLPKYDLVFAKARCALEALACGCAVVQADYFGAGQLVQSKNFDSLRRLNFGVRSMTAKATAAYLGEQIDCYDPADVLAVSRRLRSEASLAAAMDQLLELYRAALRFDPPDFDPLAATADFLRFHLFLSKLPFAALHKTEKVPLRLPVPPLTRPLREHWQEIKAGHEEHAERIIARLKAKLAAQVAKNEELRGKILKLKEKLALAKARRRGWKAWLRIW